MNRCFLREAPGLERLFGHIHGPDFEWISYIKSTAKDVGKMAGSLYRTSNYLTLCVFLYFYKKPDKAEIKSYMCRISPVFIFHSIESKSIFVAWWVMNYFPVFSHLSHRENFASLSLFIAIPMGSVQINYTS